MEKKKLKPKIRVKLPPNKVVKDKSKYDRNLSIDPYGEYAKEVYEETTGDLYDEEWVDPLND